MFAVTEMLVQIGEPAWAKADAVTSRLKLPDWAMWKRLFRPQAIGAAVGTFEGVTPGAGGTVAAFMQFPTIAGVFAVWGVFAVGQVLEGFVPTQTEQVYPRAHALTLVNALRGVVDEGTGTAIRSRL